MWCHRSLLLVFSALSHCVCSADGEGVGVCDLSSATTTFYLSIKVAVVSVISPCFPPQCSPWTDKAYVSPNQAASPSFSTTPLSTYTTSSVPDRFVFLSLYDVLSVCVCVYARPGSINNNFPTCVVATRPHPITRQTLVARPVQR